MLRNTIFLASWLLAAWGLLGVSGCAAKDDGDQPANGVPAADDSRTDGARQVARLTVTSPSFEDGGRIPKRHTADGEIERDISPELVWEGVPASANSLVVICDDPDAPGGDWVHWVIYNIPVDAGGLLEGISAQPEVDSPAGASQGVNSWPEDNFGYRGPAPPSGEHHYHFKVYAIDKMLEISPVDATRSAIMGALEGHVVAKGELIGLYSR